MRILIFAPNYLPATRYGGPVRSSHGLAKALVARGHDVHVVTTNVDGPGVLDVPLNRAVIIDGVAVRYFPIAAPRRLYHAPAMGQALAREIASFDVAHINGMFLWPGPAVARLARRHGVPYVVAPRGMLVPEMIAGKSTLAKRLWIALQERASLAGAAAIHVTSEEEAAGIRRLGLDLAPLAVVGNGVELPAAMPRPDEIERMWTGTPRGRRVAFLARLDWTKGLELAIEAVVAHPDAQLIVAGPDQIGLRAALEPKLGTRGRFIGAVGDDDKWALLAGADVLLAPSVKESFGLAVAEALAIGTPVICTEGVGASAIVQRIDQGAIVARRPEALARALAAMLGDAPRRAALGERARVIMAEEYTWAAVGQQMESVLAAAAQSGGALERVAA